MSLSAIAPGNAPAEGASAPRGHHSRLTPGGCHRPLATGASRVHRPELAALAEKVRQLQAARRTTLPPCPTGLTKLDAALGGGFAYGCVHELLAPADGAAARSLALWAAARAVDHPSGTCPPEAPRELKPAARQYDFASEAPAATKRSQTPPRFPDQRPAEWVFYIDTGGDFYPPGAAQLGLPLERLLVIRMPQTANALWVCEQALRCKAVAAVVLPIRTVNAYVSRRLQLAAEMGGGLGFLLRSESRSDHTFAATRLRLDPLPSKDPTPCNARDGAPVRGGNKTGRAADFSPRGSAPAEACGSSRRALLGILSSPTIPDTESDGVYVTRRVRVTLLKVREGRLLSEPFALALPHATVRETIPRPALSARPPRRLLQSRPPPLSAASAS